MLEVEALGTTFDDTDLTECDVELLASLLLNLLILRKVNQLDINLLKLQPLLFDLFVEHLDEVLGFLLTFLEFEKCFELTHICEIIE